MSPYPTRMTYRHLPNPVTSTLRITHGLCSPWHCCFSGAHPQHLWTIPPLPCQLCKKAAFPSSPFQTTNWAFYKQIWFFILGAPAWHLDEALTIQHESSSIVSNTRKEVGESSGTEAKSKTQVSSQGDCDVSIQQRACVRSGGDEGILKFSLVVIHFFFLSSLICFSHLLIFQIFTLTPGTLKSFLLTVTLRGAYLFSTHLHHKDGNLARAEAICVGFCVGSQNSDFHTPCFFQMMTE